MKNRNTCKLPKRLSNCKVLRINIAVDRKVSSHSCFAHCRYSKKSQLLEQKSESQQKNIKITETTFAEPESTNKRQKTSLLPLRQHAKVHSELHNMAYKGYTLDLIRIHALKPWETLNRPVKIKFESCELQQPVRTHRLKRLVTTPWWAGYSCSCARCD
jgi:hypothetical protein